MKIGVLSLQGGVIEHVKQIEKLGHEAIEVKKVDDLESLDGIILPGGESTTIGKLLKLTGIMEELKDKIKNGLPVWGTCAGMILLAKDIENDDKRYLELMNIKVKRNAFGTQKDSFKINRFIKDIKKDIELVFIRAPYVNEVSNSVKILCEVNNKIVAVRENNMIATAFHPELTDDTSFLEYFIEIISNSKK